MDSKPSLTIEQANKLVELPLNCISKEYPNKTGQVYTSKADLLTPHQLHPAFYGCFDWHSAVHGHWCLVALLHQFTNLEKASIIKDKLQNNISKENILKEAAYFNSQQNKNFERTYGWAWLLKLANALAVWEDDLSQQLQNNLNPLCEIIIQNYIDFLPKLQYPIRAGAHTNTAFGLLFALEFAKLFNHKKLITIIEESANRFYLKDENYPFHLEPNGFDFLSPCLEEAALIQQILEPNTFNNWLDNFLPQLKNTGFSLNPVKVSDRADGHLVHLDGLNFSRAWCLLKLAAGQLGKLNHLNTIAYQHINCTLPKIFCDTYEGGHWLGSFAVYALQQIDN